MPQREVAQLMIASLSESLIKAHTALEYLTADPRFAELRAWQEVYHAHLAQLYALSEQARQPVPASAAFAQRLPHLAQLAGAMVLGEEGELVLPTFSSKQAAGAGVGRLTVPRLLVVVADDAMNVDLAAVRAAARTGGFAWQRLLTPTRGELARELSRARQHGRPFTWLHLGAHGGPEGIELADGVIDGVWLSAQLRDVEVLLLAACGACAMGDHLGIVPWVISFAEAIETNDAALFASAFWMAMGRHRRAEDALDEALDAVSLEVGEFVRRHW